MLDDIKPWLILTQVFGLHGKHIDILSSQFGTVEDIVKAPVIQLQQAGLPQKMIVQIKQPKLANIKQVEDWLRQGRHYFIYYHHPQYPPVLKNIADPPLALFIAGDVSYLSRPQLAMVGSRNPSPQGKAIAYEFATALSSLGIIITSGLALGIDAASHQGAIDNEAATIAVLGSGLKCIYPKRHEQLAEKIKEQGCLVSEFALHTPPNKMNFPIRNRIISGLSLGTLVIEATLRSGSLITARIAAEQGREVFAVPGSITNPLAQGCHKLLQDGAKLVIDINDILVEIKEFRQFQSMNVPLVMPKEIPWMEEKLDPESHILLNCLGPEAASVDELVIYSGLEVAKVTALLLKLEINGYITSLQGGYIRVK